MHAGSKAGILGRISQNNHRRFQTFCLVQVHQPDGVTIAAIEIDLFFDPGAHKLLQVGKQFGKSRYPAPLSRGQQLHCLHQITGLGLTLFSRQGGWDQPCIRDNLHGSGAYRQLLQPLAVKPEPRVDLAEQERGPLFQAGGYLFIDVEAASRLLEFPNCLIADPEQPAPQHSGKMYGVPRVKKRPQKVEQVFHLPAAGKTAASGYLQGNTLFLQGPGIELHRFLITEQNQKISRPRAFRETGLFFFRCSV